MDALVFVHFSSLDSFAELYGEREARKLAARVLAAAEEHDGPIFVIDQMWPYRGRRSEARRHLAVELRTLMLGKDLEWVRWDETNVPWSTFLRNFSELLKSSGVTSVRLGGVWFDPHGEFGCTTEVAQHLSKGFQVQVDEAIVGCVPEKAQ